MGLFSKITDPFKKVLKNPFDVESGMNLLSGIDPVLAKPIHDEIMPGLFPEDPDLEGASEDAFQRELLRLERVRLQQERVAEFSGEEGEGIARTAEFEFGDQFDLEDLTQEQRAERSSGRLAKENTDTGLIL